MYKIDLRLKTLFPAIIGTRDKHSDIEFRVIAENGIDIDKNAVITITDVANDIYGVENIYAYKDSLIIEVKRDPDEDDFDEDDCSTYYKEIEKKKEELLCKEYGLIKYEKETAGKYLKQFAEKLKETAFRMSTNSNEKFIYAQNVDVILDKLLKEYKE